MAEDSSTTANGVTSGVSIAMATYNGAKFLRLQLNSITAQKSLPAELVVTDDASTDATVDILNEFAAVAPFPVRIHRNPVRLGYRANFMLAMSHCQRDIIALCDQDDIWEPGKIDAVLDHFKDPDTTLFFHGASLMDENSVVTGPAEIFSMPPRSAPLSYYPMFNPFGFSIAFRRSLARFSDLWPQSLDSLEHANRMAHDQWLFFVASVFGVVAYSDAPLVRYRQHGSNAYGWKGSTGIWHRKLAEFRQNNGEKYAQLAQAAAARARILHVVLQNQERYMLSPIQRERAEASRVYYEKLSLRIGLRSEIYLAPRADRRISASARLLWVGGYGKDQLWGIGRKGLLKDAMLGLLFRPLLLRDQDQQALSAASLRQDLRVD